MTYGHLPNARGVLTDQEIADMAERNRARAERLIRQMGAKYVCHPANAQRKRRGRK